MAVWEPVEDFKRATASVVLIESFFGISLILKFFLEFKTEDEPLAVRDLGRIANRYLKRNFILDAIPLLPLP